MSLTSRSRWGTRRPLHSLTPEGWAVLMAAAGMLWLSLRAVL